LSDPITLPSTARCSGPTPPRRISSSRWSLGRVGPLSFDVVGLHVTFTDQSSFDVRLEWGPRGVAALADCRTFIIVDVLSFCTCVAMAAERDITIFPHPARDVGAAEFAERQRALLAGPRGAGYSLSPASLTGAPRGTRLVLPSPNGAAISLEAGSHGHVLAGCLRNRSSVCARAAALGGPFGIILCWFSGNGSNGVAR
jgi:2-phosphosulfolactate phosphatase